MIRSPFGPHITDYRDWGRIDAYIESTRPRASLVLGDAALVHHLCDKFPDMAVVARRWGTEEDNIHRRVNGAQFADDIHAWLDGDPRPLRHWLNEPTYTGLPDTEADHLADDVRVIAETQRFYERTRVLGATGIGPNWAAYWPLRPARFAPLFRSAVEHEHMIGMHYYAGFTWTRDYPATQWMLDVTDAITAIEPGLLIGGTEFGLDAFPDLVASGALPRTGPPWALVDELGFGLEHIAAWDNTLRLRPNIRWLLTFTWGGWFGPDYDISQARTFQDVMASQTGQWAVQQPLPAEEDDVSETWRACTILVLAPRGSNVRAKPHPQASRVGGLLAGEHPGEIGDIETAEGYIWAHIRTSALQGWIALSKDDQAEIYAAYSLPDLPPEPPTDPDPAEPEPPTGGEEANAAALELVSQARALLDAAMQLLIGKKPV